MAVITRFRCASPDPIRCRYTDCPEQHPTSPDCEDGVALHEEEWVTCPTCRREMGLPPLEPDQQEAALRGLYLKMPRQDVWWLKGDRSDETAEESLLRLRVRDLRLMLEQIARRSSRDSLPGDVSRALAQGALDQDDAYQAEHEAQEDYPGQRAIEAELGEDES